MNICAVIVLYHPGIFLNNYIETYYAYVDKLFIIDNSEIKSPEIFSAIKKRFPNNKIRLIYNDTNIGIASALNQGFLLAEQEGFKWVLTMDQDSYFASPDFFEMSIPLMVQNNIGIIAASFRKDIPFKQGFSDDFYKYLIVITSGNLVNTDAWKRVGGFYEKLFIDEVDNDFCIRLAMHGYIVIGSKNIFLKHKLGESFSIQPTFYYKKISLAIHHPLRVNYIMRNRLLLIKKYLLLYPKFCLNRIYHSILLFAFIIFFYPQKRRYISAFCKGITDFLQSRYGKIIRNNF